MTLEQLIQHKCQTCNINATKVTISNEPNADGNYDVTVDILEEEESFVGWIALTPDIIDDEDTWPVIAKVVVEKMEFDLASFKEERKNLN